MQSDATAVGLQKFLNKWIRTPNHALVVGSKCYKDKIDRRTLYPRAFGVDLFEGDGVDLVHDLETPLPETVGPFDHVDCCSVLEHVRRPWLLAANVEAVLDEGGTILVSVPFVWRVHSYPSDIWRMTPEALTVLFPSIQWVRCRFFSNGKFVDKAPTRFENGERWLARTEIVAAGKKCKSIS